jgi:hypothetical protein
MTPLGDPILGEPTLHADRKSVRTQTAAHPGGKVIRSEGQAAAALLELLGAETPSAELASTTKARIQNRIRNSVEIVRLMRLAHCSARLWEP